MILTRGADANERMQHQQQSVLSAAIASNRFPVVVALLIQHRADVNHIEADGKFPLYHAAHALNSDACYLLLDARADATTRYLGGSLLQWAEAGDRELSYLLQYEPFKKRSRQTRALLAQAQALAMPPAVAPAVAVAVPPQHN